jgi:hypothetical protein
VLMCRSVELLIGIMFDALGVFDEFYVFHFAC